MKKENFPGWPRFRDNFRATVSQDYVPVGLQHILVPEPVRYLSDRLVAVNVQVPDAVPLVNNAVDFGQLFAAHDGLKFR